MISAYGASRVRGKTGKIQSAVGSIWKVSLAPNLSFFHVNEHVDLSTVYVYRLCLEYARLAADNRDTMDFILQNKE